MLAVYGVGSLVQAIGMASGLTGSADLLDLPGVAYVVFFLVVAAGFNGHGFGLGPAIGQTVRELIVDGETTVPLAPLRLSRFAPGTLAALHAAAAVPPQSPAPGAWLRGWFRGHTGTDRARA